jgi:oxygen-dependent protoporphyrinogen oxidase
MNRVVVVGGGISGLSTAFNIQEKARDKGIDVDITLIEASEKLGGKVQTMREKGYTIEVGANGFLDNKPSTLKLVDALGINDLLQPSNDVARKRFIYSDGKLKQLPESPIAFLKSDLLSLKGKMRVAMEIFTKPKPEGEEETIAEFARRHMGQEAVNKLIAPMVSGVFGGDAEKLSMESCFPLLLEVEKEGNGSLIRGMIKRMKQAKKTGIKMKATAGPGGRLTSFKGGIQTLIDTLAEKIEGDIIKGKRVEKISRIDDKKPKYIAELEGNDALEADIIITATPAYTTSKMIKELDPEISQKLLEIPYVPISVVALGYNRKELNHPLDGFGFLVARNEKRKIIGCLWTSSIFPGRAPEGKYLFRIMIGGAMQPELALLSKDQLINIAKGELMEIMGIDAEPIFAKVFRHEKGIPQYTLGHKKRLEIIEKRLNKHPGLFMTGNAFRGVGINYCTADAYLTSQKVVGYLS